MKFNINDCTVVVTTFHAGDKLIECLNKIPKKFKILIIDNGLEEKNINLYQNKYKNLKYYIPDQNLGVPRSYSLANKLVNTKLMFTTQPDVEIKENCIEFLIEAINKYENAAILSPTIYHNNKYDPEGDFKVLKIRNKKLLKSKNYKNNFYDEPPFGDLSVDAVTGTAMLIDRDKINKIGDWDKNIFNYYEDMDLCLRLRYEGYEILKIRKSEVNHVPFSSHDKKYDRELDFSRNWHYSWSTYYFFKKHSGKVNALLKGINMFFKSSLKFIIYLLLNRNKSRTHFAKAYGILYSILNLKSNYRPKIKK